MILLVLYLTLPANCTVSGSHGDSLGQASSGNKPDNPSSHHHHCAVRYLGSGRLHVHSIWLYLMQKEMKMMKTDVRNVELAAYLWVFHEHVVSRDPDIVQSKEAIVHPKVAHLRTYVPHCDTCMKRLNSISGRSIDKNNYYMTFFPFITKSRWCTAAQNERVCMWSRETTKKGKVKMIMNINFRQLYVSNDDNSMYTIKFFWPFTQTR